MSGTEASEARLFQRRHQDACRMAREEKARLVVQMHADGATDTALFPAAVAKIYADVYSGFRKAVIDDLRSVLAQRSGNLDEAAVVAMKGRLESSCADTARQMIDEVGGPKVPDLTLAVREALAQGVMDLKRDLAIEFEREAIRPLSTQEVFLSHAAVDEPLAALIAREIERIFPGRHVFVASRPGDIKVGQKWLEEIERHLQDRGPLVVLVTPNSVMRPWLWFEVGASWFMRDDIIAVCVGLEKAAVPAPLGARQLLSLDRAAEVRQLFRQLGGEYDGEAAELVKSISAARSTVTNAPGDAPKHELLSLLHQLRLIATSFPRNRSNGEQIRSVTLWPEADTASLRALAATFGMPAATLAAEAHRHLITVADLARQVQNTGRQPGFEWERFDWPRWISALDGAERCLLSLADVVDPKWRSLV